MSRELRPDLFQKKDKQLADPTSSRVIEAQSDLKNMRNFVGLIEFQVLTAQVESLKKQVSELKNKYIVQERKIEESKELHSNSLNRMKSILTGLESLFKSSIQELNGKYKHLTGRVKSSHLHEEKMESLVARHIGVINKFEIKVDQLNKIISEQSYQLLSAKASLDSAKKDIEKLKRL